MKAVLLCRVSSKEQEETGYSLPAQEKLLKEYSEKKDLKVDKVFSISESASGSKQRKLFTEMLRYVQKQKINTIVCEKADRLTRNLKDAVQIYDWLKADEERSLHLVKDSLVLHKNSRSQEKLNWDIRIVFAKNYIDNLSEEVKKGQKEKLAQGWLPTRPPLGYLTVGEKGHKTHVIDEIKAPLIKKMFKLYSSGDYSIKKLTKKMQDEGLRNASGSKVVISRIHTLLTDPFYIGKNKWNDKLYEGNQQTFISEEVFNKVQGLLKSKTTPKYRKHNFLFKSLFKCEECGGTVTWEIQREKNYGHCSKYRECTQNLWAREDNVEEQLLTKFGELEIKNKRIADWIRKALKESHKDEIEYHTTTQHDLQSRYDRIQKRLDNLYDDKLDEKISEDFYQRKFEQYSREKDEITQTIQKHSQAGTKYYQLGMNIYEISQHAKEIYLKAKKKNKTDKQRQLMRFVYKNMTLNNGKVGYEYTPAFQLLSEAVEFTNRSKMTKTPKIENKIFEQTKSAVFLENNGTFYKPYPALLRGVYSVRTYFRNPEPGFYLPLLKSPPVNVSGAF